MCLVRTAGRICAGEKSVSGIRQTFDMTSAILIAVVVMAESVRFFDLGLGCGFACGCHTLPGSSLRQRSLSYLDY